MKSRIWVAAAIAGFAAPHAAVAKSGADLLLKSFKGKVPQAESSTQADAPVAQDAGIGSVEQFKLTDPVAVQFFAAWNDQRADLSPDLNHWATTFLKGDWEQALHLWEGIESRIPASFRPAAQAARLASLAHLGLAQVTVEEWIDQLSSFQGKGASWVSILESTLPRWLSGSDDPSATWDKVLLERGVILTAERQNEILRMDPSKRVSIVSLQAYAQLRKGTEGRKLLPLLRPENRLKLPLAQTVALGLARKGDLAAAAMTLKEHAEPALENQKDLSKVSGYLLQIARFLFQAGMWEEAESYLRKIPTSAPEFLNSREELAWILLRKGDVSVLRGEIASLGSSSPSAAAGAASVDSFRPELPVVRAISNLKLCSYGAVQKDFADFQQSNSLWAREIDQALSAQQAPAPKMPDLYTRLAELRLQATGMEVSKLADLHVRSLKTATPSVVGRQGQWKRLETAMRGREQLARKLVQAEYLRQWKNQKMLLAEAIRKMRFVKVELLHQMRQALADQGKGMDVITTMQGAPIQAIDQQDSQSMVFPLDGVLWPDELFKIQGMVENRCLRALKGAGGQQ